MGQSHMPTWELMGQLQLDDAVSHISPTDWVQSALVRQVVLPYPMGAAHKLLLYQLVFGAWEEVFVLFEKSIN